MTLQPEQSANESLVGALSALQELAIARPDLAAVLGELVAIAAAEVSRNGRLADALSMALAGERPEKQVAARRARRARREPGPWDPYVVYADQGEQALRNRLAALDLEQLRNIVAEHGMDSDRLAMKWRDPERVVGRIIDRVRDRAAKGEGFRAPTGQRVGGPSSGRPTDTDD